MAPQAPRRPARAARPRTSDRGVTAAPRGRAVKVGVLAFLVLACLVSVLAPLSAYVQQQSELAALQQDVAGSQGRVDALQTEVDRWQDPAYVTAQARSRLHYVMPGETGYVVLDAPADTGTSEALAATTAPTDTGSWYASLWRSTALAGQDQQ